MNLCNKKSQVIIIKIISASLPLHCNQIAYWLYLSQNYQMVMSSLFDQDFQKEINEKMDALSKRITEIKTGSQDFYENVNKAKLDDLYSGFTSSKDVEQVIFNTIAKMESLKNNHEGSAFISLKIKDLIEQQEKISITINENCGILDKLKENITKNVEVMKKNIEIINKKLK